MPTQPSVGIQEYERTLPPWKRRYPMKVVFIIHRMHPNLLEVHNALVSFGHECVFIAASIGPSEPKVFDDRILVDPHALSVSGAKEILDQQKPDLLVQRKIDGKFLLFWNYARSRGFARVLYTQDPHQVPLADAFVRPARVVRLCRDLIAQRITLGPHVRITPVKFWGRSGMISFPHSRYVPFPARVNYPDHSGDSRPLTILTVAKHGQKRKRVEWLIKALRQSTIPFRLVITGATPSATDRLKQAHHARFLQSLQALGASAGNVEIHEDLGRDEMDQLYSRSDAFVLPSKRELMAISPLEAMSHGLPVLVSSDGGAASYVLPTGNEQIFHARSYADFQKKLFRLLEDRGLRTSLSERVRHHVESVHSPRVFVDRLLGLAHRPHH